MLDEDTMRARMANGWRKGRPFTVCGDASLPDHTENIRAELPHAFDRYRINVVNDAGAGDLKWREGTFTDVLWRNFDLIPRRSDVVNLDITTQVMPKADAIICRWVLNHLAGPYDDAGVRDNGRISMALDRFRESGTRYLFATQHNREHLGNQSPELARLDLRDWLDEPVETWRDGNPRFQYTLALWEINQCFS